MAKREHAGVMKQRSIQYSKRDGNPRIEYWIVDAEGFISTCPPRAWHKIDLPDETEPSVLEKAASMRLAHVRNQFKHRVEDNQLMRDKGMSIFEVCEHHGITY